MLRRLFKWIERLFQKERPLNYRFVQDVPPTLKRRTIYVVGENGYHWQIVMQCPCGCKAVLHMNLMEDEKPSWSYAIGKTGSITIRPSIHRVVGCKSHFFVCEGIIIWA